jgi:hypothetical protein
MKATHIAADVKKFRGTIDLGITTLRLMTIPHATNRRYDQNFIKKLNSNLYKILLKFNFEILF